MDIQMLKITEIVPYEKNPRKNDEAVQYVAESIKQFGFKVPIVIDKNKVIVTGHTRLKAAKKLKLKTVPCVIADDLTEEQVKAFRLADNKVSEAAEWDFDLLFDELEDLIDFDMEAFGFELPEDEEEEQEESTKLNEKFRTDSAYNLWDFDPERTEGAYQMPMLYPCHKIPKRMVGFNYAMTSKDYDACIHFYLDDYQFERVWNSPETYIEILQKFDMVLTPSYSVYMDMAEPLKIYNVFRGRLLGHMLQDNNVQVVPIVYWADERSFDYCFDGIPENSVVSTLTMGTSDPEVWEHWKRGMDELIKRKRPKTILLYGNGLKVDYDFGDIKVIYYQNEVTERMKNEN